MLLKLTLRVSLFLCVCVYFVVFFFLDGEFVFSRISRYSFRWLYIELEKRRRFI